MAELVRNNLVALLLLFFCSENGCPNRDGVGTGEGRREIFEHGSASNVGDGIFFGMTSCSRCHSGEPETTKNQFLASRLSIIVIGLLIRRTSKVRVTNHKSLLKLPTAAPVRSRRGSGAVWFPAVCARQLRQEKVPVPAKQTCEDQKGLKKQRCEVEL